MAMKSLASSMIEIKILPISLVLKNPFTLAHGSSVMRENVFIQITYGDFIGYGEAPIVPYYHISKEEVIEDITFSLGKYTPDELTQMIKSYTLPTFRYATTSGAYQTAIITINSAMLKKSPSSILAIDEAINGSKTTFTIAYHEEIKKMVEIAKACEYSNIKIKAGMKGDIIRIKSIREALPDVNIFVDANQGWSVKEAKEACKELENERITLIEEPIKGSAMEIEEIASISSIPIYLDESIQGINDIQYYSHKAPHIKGIVAKSAKFGGPLSMKEVIEVAQNNNLSVFLSSMIESSVAIASVIPFIPLCDYIDLDGPLLITNTPFTGIVYDRERLMIDSNGVQPQNEIKELFSKTKAIQLRR